MKLKEEEKASCSLNSFSESEDFEVFKKQGSTILNKKDDIIEKNSSISFVSPEMIECEFIL